MADLSKAFLSDIPDKIYRFHEKKQKDWRRPHLGASLIGRDCERALWYSFRWAKAPVHDGRLLRLFETGQLAEDRIFMELKNICVKVYGEQTNVEIFPHFGGSCDGIGEGFTESAGPHILEVKTHSDKSFQDLEKKGVQESKPEHFAQMQVYIGGLGIDRAYYLAINKNTDHVYAERVKFDRSIFDHLIDKAKRVIFSSIPPCKNESFKCKFCDYNDLCNAQAKPEVNCRTCCHSTPCENGFWSCKLDHVDVCENHVFIPHLLGMDPIDAGDDWIKYKTWTNGRDFTRSVDYERA
jgi:hypothetical protein